MDSLYKTDWDEAECQYSLHLHTWSTEWSMKQSMWTIPEFTTFAMYERCWSYLLSWNVFSALQVS